jgi:hypothetical protein
MIFLLRNMDSFHKHQSGVIYTIGEIVSHMVPMTINNEGHFRSASSYDMIEHIDIIVETGDSKKACQIKRS